MKFKINKKSFMLLRKNSKALKLVLKMDKEDIFSLL